MGGPAFKKAKENLSNCSFHGCCLLAAIICKTEEGVHKSVNNETIDAIKLLTKNLGRKKIAWRG
jgi:hypothetical protein